MKYKNLGNLIEKRGIKKTVIAKTVGITERSLGYKLSGTYPFTWEQVCKIQKSFFPDMTKDDLFATDGELTAERAS